MNPSALRGPARPTGSGVDPPGSRTRARARWWGLGAAVVSLLAFLPGSGRAFGYDASVTVGSFVRTPSLLDPFRRQVVYNNHVGFSFLEHVISSATGSTDERLLRLLPILCGAACVGLVVAELAARTTTWIALTAGALLATNPLFTGAATEVRGYSLLCLCAVASTIVLLRSERSDSTGRGVLYVVCVAIGLATHLYMLFVVAGHVTWIVARRELSWRWSARWVAGAALGGCAYLGIVSAMRSAGRGSVFAPGFGPDLVRAMLGSWPVTVAVTGVGVVVACWPVRRRPETRALALLSAAVVAGLWLVLAPRDLYPRFFVWAVPGVAVLAALGLGRLHRRALVTAAVVVACAGSFVVGYRDRSSDDLANRAVAGPISAAQARGEEVCGLGSETEALAAYATGVRPVDTSTGFAGCDVLVVLIPGNDPRGVDEARATFGNARRVDAGTPGLLLWR